MSNCTGKKPHRIIDLSFFTHIDRRKTKSKLIAYLSNLLGSNNVNFKILGDELKVMLIIG